MTHHAIWPEGLPDDVRQTTSAWRAHAIVLGMRTAWMFPLRRTRRIRHARSEKAVDAAACEQALREAGAISPPGGWPESASKADADVDVDVADTHVATLSVI